MGELLTKKEVADLYGVTTRTVERWMRNGAIEYVKTPGGTPRFDRDKIFRAPEARAPVEPEPKPDPEQEKRIEAYRWVREKLLRRSLRMRKFE